MSNDNLIKMQNFPITGWKKLLWEADKNGVNSL